MFQFLYYKIDNDWVFVWQRGARVFGTKIGTTERKVPTRYISLYRVKPNNLRLYFYGWVRQPPFLVWFLGKCMT